MNAIARGNSGCPQPALYRYFRSRDELISALIDDAYGDLAEAGSRRRPPAAGRRRPASAPSRPHTARGRSRTRAATRSPSPSCPPGYREPEALAAVAHRSMIVILDALAALGPADDATAGPARRPAARMGRGAARHARASPPPSCGSASWTWSRLHGLVALELLGTYAQMGIDPAPLYAHEVETLLAAAGS